MLEIKGFRGLRYNPGKAIAYDDVITPPFDVVSPSQRADLAGRSPYNMVHAILPVASGGLNPYQDAAQRVDSWIADGVMTPDPEDSYYLLEQRFTDRFGHTRTRRAFYGLARIPETGERTVLGHEKTFPHKIQDRLALTRATQTQFGAIFVLYDDPEHALASFLDHVVSRPPDVTARTIDDVVQRLWRVPVDPAVAEFFSQRHVYIADGHHRFATATAYRDEMRAHERNAKLRLYDFVMMGFVALDDPGLAVYPAHRLLDLPPAFTLDQFRATLDPYFDVRDARNGIVSELAQAPKGTLGMVFATGEKLLLEVKPIDRAKLLGTDHGPAWRDLDVALLHRGIFENLMGLPAGTEYVYEPDPNAALAACARGEKGVACLLNPATPQQIRACAEAGEFMPQKATYLFPKLPTGGVIYRHE